MASMAIPCRKSTLSENPQTELAMNDKDFQDDKLWKSLADIDWDENWSEIKQICGLDSLCCVQQVADYCYNSATKIQEPEADNLCNEMVQGAAGQMMKTRRFKKVVDEKDIKQAIVIVSGELQYCPLHVYFNFFLSFK